MALETKRTREFCLSHYFLLSHATVADNASNPLGALPARVRGEHLSGMERTLGKACAPAG